MAAKNIGIKLYNDSFVPVLKSGEIKAKKLVLTTVRNNQKKAIIELYEGTSDKCIHNEYLGKLNIKIDRETKKGDPAIEVNLRLDENGILYAKAWDTESKEQSEIHIEHSGMKTILPDTMSDREIRKTGEKPARISINDNENQNLFNIIRTALIVLAVILLLALLIFGGWFVNKQFNLIAMLSNKNRVEKKEPVKKENTPVKMESSKSSSSEPVQKEKIIGEKSPKGIKHYIRWGDNLWNICKKYYDDPWYYPALAEANNIKNPRLIYAGTNLIIPPKSDLKRWDFR